MKQIIASTIFVITSVFMYGQTPDLKTDIKPTIELNYLNGELKNPISIPNQTNSHYVQLSITNPTATNPESLYAKYRSPNIGLSALYGYLGSKDVLGSLYSVYPTWNYTFFKEKSLGLDFKFGTGLAYFTTPYNKETNPTNHLVGSHISNITEFSPSVWFKFSDAFTVQSGISYLHFSNGHTAIPNIGVNDLTVKLGVIYKPGTLANIHVPTRTLGKQDSVWRKSISVSLGRHKLGYATYPTDGPTYNIYKVSGYMHKQFAKIHEIQFGLSLTYYDSYYTFIRFEDYYEYFKLPKSTVTTAHVAHEFLFKKFGFVTDLGIKIFDPFYRDFFITEEKKNAIWSNGLITSKIGFEFYPFNTAFSGKKLSMGMFIKTNLAQADFVEYNLTYSF